MKQIIILTFLLFAGCASYTITKDSLVDQLSIDQKVHVSSKWTFVGSSDYLSNSLEKIKCVDEDGAEIWLYPDKNTQFEITVKNQDVIKCYFNTLYLQNDTLFGQRSRILGGKRAIALSDIDQIVITAEFPKTERVVK